MNGIIVSKIIKYLILELKKDKADINTIQQTMRYVDWICKEYASGDYSLVKAGVVAFEYSSLDLLRDTILRILISSTHPIVTKKWNDLTCLTYKVLPSYEIELKNFKYFIIKIRENIGLSITSKKPVELKIFCLYCINR